MYIQIDRNAKVEKLVGSFYLNIVSDDTAELYIILGRNEVGIWVSYRIDAVKIYTNSENYHQKSFIDEDSLINAYNLFTKKILFGQINAVDVTLTKTFSSAKCKTPMQFKKIETDILSNWYMKNRFVVKDLPNVIFSEKTQKDFLQKIKKSDLQIGRLYISKGNTVYAYIGYIDNQYMFEQIGQPEEDITDHVISYKEVKGQSFTLNKTKSLPALFVLDDYPVNLLPKSLQNTRAKWYKKKYTFSYKSCLEFSVISELYSQVSYLEANQKRISELCSGIFKDSNLPLAISHYFTVVEKKTALPMTITLLPENTLLKTVYLKPDR